MKSPRWWRRYAAFAGVLGAAGMAVEIPSHSWPQLGVTVAATAVTLLSTRRGFTAAAHAETRGSHRPDYAKIRRLEIELGLVEPPDPEPVVPVTLITRSPLPETPLEAGGERYISDAYAALRQAQEAAAKWQMCPVCLRRHEGRCAG